MKKNKLMKKISTDNKHYIYDTWTNEILEVHKDFWNYLPDFDNGHVDQKRSKKTSNHKEVSKEIKKAQEQGYLSTERPEIEIFYDRKNWRKEIAYQIDNNLQQISLNVTEKCNFRCVYCPYSDNYKLHRDHSNKNMTWAVAKKAIEYGIMHSNMLDKRQALAISFYGGEPLCNFNLIKKSVLFCRDNYPDKNIKFNMTTNGSLITNKIANFLIDNKFSILLSVDGPKSLHDRYRKTINGEPTHSLAMKAYDLLKKIDKKKQARISFNCLLSPPFDLLKVNDFVSSVNKSVKVSLVSSEDSTFFSQFSIEKDFYNYELQRRNIFDNYKKSLINTHFENIDKMGRSMFESGLLTIENREMNRMESKVPSQGQCIPGAKKLFVSCEGDFYPCEKTTGEFCIGNVKTGMDYLTIYRLLEDWSNQFRYKCNNCWAVRLCGKCLVSLEPSNNFGNDPIQKLCFIKKKTIEQNLEWYCSILETNPNSLVYMKDVYVRS